MADLKHFTPNTVTETAESITAVGGQKIKLIRKGMTTVNTTNGILTVSEAYYAEGLEFSLISVPQLVRQGVNVHFSDEKVYIEKDTTRIFLQ